MPNIHNWPPWVWVVSACVIVALVGAGWRFFRWFMTHDVDMH